ncbi:MAG: hypothetical protein IKR33_02330 [Bacteroidales bacterium]|nr:hypothetical protein [Bacteroidales bacterium]
MSKTRLVLVLGLLALMACNSEEHKVRQAAQGYLDATANYDVQGAVPYATKQTRENTLPFMEKLIALTDTAYIASNTPATVVIDSVQMLDDTSYVFYTKTTPIKVLSHKICVVKEDGQWLVDVIVRADAPFKPVIDTMTVAQ